MTENRNEAEGKLNQSDQINKGHSREEVPFDTLFRNHNDIWNSPDYAKNADDITMETKMKDAAPYNVFFNTLKHCPETKEQLYSISFTDLLCPSLGKLKCSLQIYFITDIDWILMQFAKRKLHKLPMTILHGHRGFPWPEKDTMEELYPDIDQHFIKTPDSYGFNHTRMSVFVYEDDSLRIVIGSANLHDADWEIYNQQLWISPACPKLPEESSVFAGESPTGFKNALLDYLFTYKEYNIPSMEAWIERVKGADFSAVKVALLYTVPGVHYERKNGCFIHFLGHLLSRDCTIPAPKEEYDSWQVITQTASLGLVGLTPGEWLTTYFLKSLTSHKDQPYFSSFYSESKTKFSLIYPTVQNTLKGYLGPLSATGTLYEKSVKGLQPWLLKYKCQWKADGTKRTRAIAQSKCYCRISPCWTKMAYLFLASSNLARSAWGRAPNKDHGIYIRSYEVGVLFLPKYFEEEYFEVKDSPDRKNKRLFPMMFDLPLTPYGPNDDSYCGEEFIEWGLISDSDESESDDDEKDTSQTNPKGTTAVRSNENHEEHALRNTSFLKPAEAGSSGDVTNNNSQVALTPKKDMKFSSKPNNLFFPSFK